MKHVSCVHILFFRWEAFWYWAERLGCIHARSLYGSASYRVDKDNAVVLRGLQVEVLNTFDVLHRILLRDAAV